MKPSLSYYGYSDLSLRQLLEEKAGRLRFYGEGEFIGTIEEMAGILSRIDRAPSALMQAVDVKGQDYATYFAAAYADGLDLDASMTVYRRVRTLVRIIVLMDRFFEVGSEKYRQLGQALMSQIRKDPNPGVRNILRFNMKQFWPFWKFEYHTKNLMQKGHSFSLAEIRNFNLFKSSDAALLYAPVLEASVPNFNHNAAIVLHYNQALQDIEDDLDDIREDLQDEMPNIFILAALGSKQSEAFSHLYRHRLNGSRASILENASDSVLQIVSEYDDMIEGITLPNQFMFLKHLSRHYSARIRKKMPIGKRRHSLVIT